VSEIAAKAPAKLPAKAPTRPRRRLIASRLVPYLLLQVLIVIATILGCGCCSRAIPTISR